MKHHWTKDEATWIKIKAGSIVEIPVYNEETDTFGAQVVKITEDIGCAEMMDGKIVGEVVKEVPAPPNPWYSSGQAVS
jgi:hypothetical protein